MMKWKKKKLSEFCEFSNGLWTGKKPPFQTVGVIRNTNFTKDCQLDDADIVYLEVEQSQLQKRKLQYGDIILEKSGGGPKQPVGRVVIFDKTDGDFSFSNFTSVIRIKNKSEVDFNFLHRYLFLEYISGATEKMQSHSTGIRNLKFDEYKEIEIPLPPLPEQQRIVSILDEAFAAIAKAKANAEQNLKNAKELFESYLQGVFENIGDGWEEKKLGKVFEIKPPKREAKEKLSDSDFVSFLPMEDLGVCENEIKPTKEKPLKDVVGSYTYFAENDVLLAKITPCFENGKLGVAKNLTNGIGFGSSEYIVFRCPEKIIPEFIFYFLSRESFRKEGKKYMSGAVGHKRVSKDWIENYLFTFPKTKEEQQTIVRQLDALRAEMQKLKAVYQKKIDDLEELKKSILQRAFAGELGLSSSTKQKNDFNSLQKVEGISTTDLQAGITALALQKHIERGQQHTFHHVKAEKIIHLSEYVLNIDLDRRPKKDAAGPNDFPQAKKVESRAKKAGFYTVYKNGQYYDYKPGKQINTVVQKALDKLGDKANDLSKIIELLVPMTTQQAEIVATVFAAWNNLLLIGSPFTDEEIVTEARENWHNDKLKIPRDKFVKAIEWIRANEIFIPKGNGKIIVVK